MKKLLLIAAVCLLGVLDVSAQYYPRNIIGVRGGVNISSMALRQGGEAVNRDLRNPKVGWHIGAVDEIRLVDGMPLYLDLGVTLTNKGVRYVYEGFMEGFDSGVEVEAKSVTQYGIGYLQFPVCASYHIYFGDFTLQPYAGLHYDVGLWGRQVYSTRVRSEQNKELNSRSKSVESLFEQERIGRSDFGLMLGFGVTYQERYYVGVSWEDGFCNISKMKGVKFYNLSNFRISVGYNF